MNDYIKRNDAINRLQEIANDYEDAGDKDAFYVADYCLHHIMELRPATNIAERKRGKWIKMSDADGIYYACSECGNDLPRVIDSFNPQFDLFPKLKCIDKTTYCPNCGAKMGEV